MAEMRSLKRISQGDIHITSVKGGDVRAAKIDFAHVDFPATPYAGAYEFTPSDETQTISISGRVAERDITINPIPQNYGLVTWNGAFLTVS